MKHFFFAGPRVGRGLFWLAMLLLALPLAGWANGPSLAEALNPDGTLRAGAQGAFDARGYRVQAGPDGQLRLQRNAATAAADWRTGFSMSGANGPIYSVFRHGTDVYVGGYFTAIDDTPARNVARWDGTAWHALGAGLPSTISSLTVDSNGNLYAGSTTTSGVTKQGIPFARWDGTSWQTLTQGAVIVGVSTLTADDQGNVYVGGSFTFSANGGRGYWGVAKWDGSTLKLLGTGTGMNMHVGSSLDAAGIASVVYRNGSLYVGGSFNEVDKLPINNVARWDGSLWYPVGSVRGSSYNGTDKAVSSLALDSQDRIYVVGDFTAAGGLPASHAARWDGAAWAPLGTGLTKPMYGGTYSYKLTVDQQDNLYVGGGIATAGGAPVTGVAKWDGTAWSALGNIIGNYSGGTYDISGSIGDIWVDSQNQVCVAGTLMLASGGRLSALASWNGNSWDSINSANAYAASINGTILCLAADGQGNVYAGGNFTSASGVAANHIAKWDGTKWNPLGEGINADVSELAVDKKGNVYAGGRFTMAGGVAAGQIAKWDGAAWSSLNTASGSAGSTYVYSLALDSQDNLYVGGSFATIGGVAANSVAKWDGAAWSPLGSGINANSAVLALAIDSQDNIYAAGNFFMNNSNVVKWNGTTWTGLGNALNPTTKVPLSIYALVVDKQDNVYAGGETTWNGGGGPYNAVSKWDGTSWKIMSAQPSERVEALAVDAENNLYAGGLFTKVGTSVISRIARWDGSAWSSLGSGLKTAGTGGYVKALAVGSDGTVYAGGDFTTTGDEQTVSAYFGAYGAPPAPRVSGISPAAELPGQAVVVTGTGFGVGARVTFGGVAASAVVVTSATELTATVPAGVPAGSAEVVVADAAGQASAPAAGFAVLAVYDGGAASGCAPAVGAVASVGDGAWHYLLGADSAVVAAYRYSGPTLGTLALDVFQADGGQPVRQDGAGRAYLDRNWHFTASGGRFDGRQVQLRLYGLAAEQARLAAADPAAALPSLVAVQYSGANEDCELANNDAGGEWRELAVAAAQPAGTAYFVAEVRVADHFSEFYLAGGAGPLPVVLVEFTAVAAGPGAVRLGWATASEVNSAAFEVQRSAEGAAWTTLGVVAAAGSSVTRRGYGYVDGGAPAGSSYYRLRQLDQDGRVSYSPVRTVTLSGGAGLSLYPNPTRGGEVRLTGAGAGAPVTVLDVLGRAVAQATADAGGTARLALPAGLAPGVYVVRSAASAVRLAVE